MRTEIEFTLPRGYVDASGVVHREGRMRLATARDEIEPLREVEVRQNQAYVSVLLLARTITRIGEVTDVTPSWSKGCSRPTSIICSGCTSASTATAMPSGW